MKRMTENQCRAVDELDGNLAIHAGAGSGKTTVLAHRYAEAVRRLAPADGLPADRILIITFTNKAAGEIAERVRRVVASEVSKDASVAIQGAWISTIHSFCSRLLRRHVLEAGLDPEFALADEVTTRVMQDDAYERAALKLYGRDPGVTAVLETFNPHSLRTRTIACLAKARALGLSVADVHVDVDPDIVQVMRQAVVADATGLAEALASATQTPSLASKRERLADWAREFATCGAESLEECAELARIAECYSVGNIRDQNAKECNDQLRASLKRFASAARALSRPDLLEGVMTLVRRFEHEYTAAKVERGVLDFDDLQEHAVRLLSSEPIAERYRKHFHHIMVDEFQDTNDLQVRVLAPVRDDNLCVVGDERQSIYGFRYADIEVFREVSTELGETLQLSDNFRSHAEVMAFVNELFSQSHLFGPSFMRLQARREGGWSVPHPPGEPRVECVLVESECAKDGYAGEARYVADRIRGMIAAGVSPGDVAILLRSATHVDAFAEALDVEGVPASVNAGAGLFAAREVTEVMDLLRCVAVPHDDGALIGVLAGRLVGATDEALLGVRILAGRDSLWTGLERTRGQLKDALWLAPADREALAHAALILGRLNAFQSTLSLSDLMFAACEAFDYELTLRTDGPRGDRAWANVVKLARYASGFEQAERNDAAAFVEYLRRRSDAACDKPAPDAASDAVRVMTVHAAKGLEFPVVFVAGLSVAQRHTPSDVLLATEGPRSSRRGVLGMRLPTDVLGEASTPVWQQLAEENALREAEEEKRCLYVACTRAEEVLILSGGSNLEKPAEECNGLIDWVRQGLDSDRGGPASAGDAAVRVVRIAAEPSKAADQESIERESTYGDGPAPYAPLDPELAVRRRPRDVPESVSYSSLRMHEKCPLAYHARYRLGLRAFNGGAETTPLDFGSAFHAVMQAGIVPPANRVENVARAFRLSADLEEKLVRAVRRAAETATAHEIAAADRIHREIPFGVPIAGTHLRGAIDLLAWTEKQALIVDYKTGRPPGEDQSGYQLQADCYAYVALTAGADTVSVRFLFVEHDQVSLEYEYDRADLMRLKKMLERRVEQVVSVPPTPVSARGPECERCVAAGSLCSVGLRSR